MTPNFSKKSLCESCKSGSVVRGQASSEKVTFCSNFSMNKDGTWFPPFKVSDCTEYRDKASLELYQLEKIAWTVQLDRQTKGFLGFEPPKIEKE